MSRMLLLRVLLSVVTIACWAHLMGYRLPGERLPGALPLSVERPAGQDVFVVRANADPLPAPLVDGQVLDVRGMGVLDRAAVLNPLSIFNRYDVAAGSAITLLVRQKAQATRVPVSARPVQDSAGLTAWSRRMITSLLLGMALLTLWRGRDWTAWGLCVFATGLLLNNLTKDVALPLPATLWQLPAQLSMQSLLVGGLYITAERLGGAGLSQSGRRLSRCVVAACLIGSLASRVALIAPLIYAGLIAPRWLNGIEGGFLAAALVTMVAVMLAGYGRGTRESRRRLRWVLASTASLSLSVLLAILLPQEQTALLFVSNMVLPGLTVLGLLYGILRERVVDVGFVIDRALVFSITTALMFGLFSLLEQAVHRLALGEQLDWVVQGLGAVGVAAALSPLHRLLDRGLERVFFQRLRALAGALRRLGRDAAFFEGEEALLARVLKQLLVPCAAAAIYERHGAVYQRRVAQGEDWPAAVDRDDPVFVALRAEHGALDLTGLESAAGADGLAFAMSVGQLLTGAVIVRLGAGEQLDHEVRAALGELAHALGTSLYLLRYRDQERLIAEIAAGAVESGALRSRAVALLGPP